MYYYNSPLIGTIGLEESDGVLTRLAILGKMNKKSREPLTPLLKETTRQLTAYFAGQLRQFSLPLSPHGTPFMLRVWEALQQIPFGETASYKEIAEVIGNAKACRAVGMANNRNPIAIIIPCHRVIGSSGQLVGFRSGLDKKQKLLDHESRYG